MISFNKLGNMGRLGNQMFQYASTKGIATNRNFEYCVAPKSAFGVTDFNVRNTGFNIYDCFPNLSSPQGITQNTIFEERHFHFDEDLFNNCENNVDLCGYFQSAKYFQHIEKEIKKDFSFAPDVIAECKNAIGDKEWISLHIRRGDFLNLELQHPITPLDFYKESLNNLDTNLPVLIFSDDPNWCKEQDLFYDDRFLVSETNHPFYDLCLMTICKYHIIANSSYSWWGAWLSDSKQVFAPKVWFGVNYPTHNVKDLYCEGWAIL
jgi:hypothetical protein